MITIPIIHLFEQDPASKYTYYRTTEGIHQKESQTLYGLIVSITTPIIAHYQFTFILNDQTGEVDRVLTYNEYGYESRVGVFDQKETHPITKEEFLLAYTQYLGLT